MKQNRKLKNLITITLIIIICASIIFTMFYAKNYLTTSNSSLNATTPPEMPSMENSGQMVTPPEKPSGETGSMQNPPEMSSGEISNESAGSIVTNSIPSIYYVIFGIEGLFLSILIMYLIMSKFNKKTFKEIFVSSDKVTIYILCVVILTATLTLTNGYITNNYFLNNNTKSDTIPNGNQTTNISYSSEHEITESTEISSGSYTSDKSDQNALLVSGNIETTISNITVSKTGDSDGGDNTSFYGTNSAIIAKGGANLTLKNVNITTNATGANGVFSYGGSATTSNTSTDNTTINISNSQITTSKDNSGGIMTTGGGIMNATNLIVNTAGTSSAAIRSDRGGGTVNVDSGTYKTTGIGSPAIYSTAEITVKNASLISTASEGIVIEGKNSVTLENVNLTDTNNKLNGLSTTYKNIFIYQSMSGDADTGNASFASTNSVITTNKGDSFYVTNTSASIDLTNNKIVNNDANGNFLRIQKDSWGNSGSNGGTVSLNLNNQDIIGNIVVDSISSLNMSMKTDSYYEGVINGDNTAKSITLTIDATSKIKLIKDSYVSSLTDADSSYSNINFNGYKLYVNGKAINK